MLLGLLSRCNVKIFKTMEPALLNTCNNTWRQVNSADVVIFQAKCSYYLLFTLYVGWQILFHPGPIHVIAKDIESCTYTAAMSDAQQKQYLKEGIP